MAAEHLYGLITGRFNLKGFQICLLSELLELMAEIVVKEMFYEYTPSSSSALELCKLYNLVWLDSILYIY